MSGWIERPSPNFDVRREGCPIDILVLHYTGMRNAEEALNRLCDPDAKVSAHYTIDRDGRVYRHVDESLRARHAGISWWAAERDVNSRSIGIELVNPGHEFGYEPFPDAQIDALIDLAHGIFARHPVPPHRVVGHSDVAPARKMDPGELFPWPELATSGIGIFPPPPPHDTHHGRPESRPPGSERPRAERVSRHSGARWPGGRVEPGHDEIEGSVASRLAAFGYGVPPDVDVPLAAVVTAFQRHFRPGKIDGVVDVETDSRLSALLEMME
ncbi:MAG TPA: N-acetylmuramoyl-L-alanine amidase [Rhizomicrobium sp.]|nr:N-acetylmuramoyl-L-alanine amidase [Rhizomicrobium sp.]